MNPVIEISVALNGLECPSSSEVVAYFSWSGTKPGFIDAGELAFGECNKFTSTENCKNISSVSPHNFT
jgi:hypothetical protein